MRTALLTLVLAAAAAAPAAAADRFNLPEGPGRELIYGQCQTCHDLQSIVDSAGIGRGAWDAVLDNMREYGLRIDEAQRARILDYLATYLGPTPPAAAPVQQATTQADGVALYADICSACHMPDGTGKAGEFPPLAGNPDIFLAPDFPVQVVLHGLSGPIDVAGTGYDKTMPAFDFLADDAIAAIVNTVRTSWGNEATTSAPLSEADVAAARAAGIPGGAADVHTYRQSLK